MSTRLRPIVMIGNTLRTGGMARIELERWLAEMKVRIPPRGSMPEADRFIRMFESLPFARIPGQSWLWLIREPRRLAQDRSRYVDVCRRYGISPRGTKKKKRQTISELLAEQPVAPTPDFLSGVISRTAARLRAQAEAAERRAEQEAEAAAQVSMPEPTSRPLRFYEYADAYSNNLGSLNQQQGSGQVPVWTPTRVSWVGAQTTTTPPSNNNTFSWADLSEREEP